MKHMEISPKRSSNYLGVKKARHVSNTNKDMLIILFDYDAVVLHQTLHKIRLLTTFLFTTVSCLVMH